MKICYRISAILLLSLFLLNPSYANEDNLKQAWNSFINNKIEDARRNFELAANDPVTKAEANLMLSLIASVYDKGELSNEYFRKFYKTEKNPNPYIYALWMSPTIADLGGVITGDQLDFLDNLTDADEVNDIIHTMAYEALGRIYEKTNNFSKADKYWKKIGSIDDWQIAGTFENVSSSGFDKDWEPIAHPEKDYVFKNKLGAGIKWFDLKYRRPCRWIDFSYNFSFSNSTVFAQTFCTSPADQIVQLRFGTSGSIKVWVNDHLVFREPEERNCGLDVYIQPVHLNKGVNRILVQIGESEAGASNFLMRITDDKGKNVQGLSYSAKYDKTKGDYDRNYSFKAEPVPNFAEEYFKEKINQNPDKLLNYILLSRVYLNEDKKYEARKTINKAIELAPDCSFLLYQLIEVYLREKNRTQLSLTLERIKALDPDNPMALELLYNEAIDKQDYKEAKSYIEKIEKMNYAGESVYEKKIRIAAAEKDNEEFIKQINRAYEEYPYYWFFVNIKFHLMLEMSKDISECKKVIEKYLDKRYNTDAYELLADAYLKMGKVDEALEYLNKILDNQPNNIFYMNTIGKIYFNKRDYKKAADYYLKCLDIAPYIGKYRASLAQAYEQMQDSEQASQYYKTALSYNPFDYETRRNFRKMQDKKPVWDYFGKHDYYKVYESAPSSKEYPDDNSLILDDEVQKVVYKDGGIEEKQILLVKIFNTDGIDDWKEYRIPNNSDQEYDIEKAEVLKKNGNRLKAEINDNEIVFPSLESGDGILIIYKLETYQYGKLTKHFWDKSYFKFYYPYLESKYSLLIEPGIEFDFKVTNTDLKPEIKDLGEFKLYTWKKENQESIKHEKHMPPLTDIGEVLYISSIKDWDFVSKWYYDLAATKSKPDFEVQETVANLFKDKKNLIPIEKVKAIYEYIVNNIRYSYVPFRQSGIVPQKASKVINTRIGDCKDVSTLFVSMCREAGINANLVLVSTRDNGKNSMILPSIEFNHCIAKLNMDGKDYYIELTSDMNPFGAIHNGLNNAFALEISDKGEQKPVYIDPSTGLEDIISRTGSVTFDGNTMKVNKKSIKTGSAGAGMREIYKNKGKDAQNKSMLETLSPDYPNLKLTELKFDESLDNPVDSLSYYFAYSVNNVFTKISDMYIMKVPFADAISTPDFVSTDKRNYPIEILYYGSDTKFYETMEINIPPDKKLVEIPEPAEYSCFAADYSLIYRQEGSKLIADRKLTFKTDVVPLDKYDEFKKFIEAVVTSDTRQIPFRDASVPSPTPAKGVKLGKGKGK